MRPGPAYLHVLPRRHRAVPQTIQYGTKSESYDSVDRKHGLAALEPVIPRPRAEGVFVSDLGANGEQVREAVRYPNGPAR